jgi:uncharacterized SAM-binding protein YcdF (DUF218 family)
MLFFLRKLVATAVTPSLWGFGAIVVGIVMLCFVRTRRFGKVFVLWGSAWLVVLALGFPFDIAGRWLEGRHPALLDVDAASEVEWIVVLGGGHREEAWLPQSAHLNESSVFRAVEGVRLSYELPEATLLFTGYGGDFRRSAAAVGADFAHSLGVDSARVALAGDPRTTGEEARAVRELAGAGPVILVTSATHMERSVRLFEREGVVVIPAPTGHRALDSRSMRSGLSAMPHRLAYADAVAHELVGLLVLRWQ